MGTQHPEDPIERCPMTALPEPGDPLACYVLDLSSWTRVLYEVSAPARALTGERIEVVRAFCSRLRRLLVEQRPAFLGVGADVPAGPSVRRSQWSAYKAGRKAPGEAYDAQHERCVQVLGMHQVPVCRGGGLEADDWVAALAAHAHKTGMRVVVISRDHDLWQLVDDTIPLVVWDQRTDEAVGEREVRARYHGLLPTQLADMWALAGQGDEAPGIEGVGEKTAAELLRKRQGLEEVLRKWQWHSGVLGTRLRDGAASARLSRELVRLRADAPLDVQALDLRVGWQAEDAEKLRQLAAELGIEGMRNVAAFAPKPLDARLVQVPRIEG